MAELAFPLEGHVYSAREAGLWFATRTSGVHASDSLAVTDGGGMSVSVGSGVAWLKYAEFTGAAYANTAAKIMAIEAADNTLPRVDRVVVRYSNTYNNIALAVVKGTPASTPVPPAITRDSLTYEISLARVRVNAGVKAITAYDITDERMDNTVCGLMTDGVTPFDPEMGGIIVDDTLTTEGAAADAKAVGDAIEETNVKINKKALEILQSRAAAVHAENHRCIDTITWDGEIGDRETVVEETEMDTVGVIVLTYVRVWDEPVPLDNGFTVDALFDNPGFDAFYSMGYRYERINEQISVVFDVLGGEFFGEACIYPAVWCVSGDNAEWGNIVFPKQGLYFTTATAREWGIPYRTKSLTVNNYDFGDVADPIAPEMISAAPKFHASASETHGVATNKLFGHARVFGYQDVPVPGVEADGQNRDLFYNQTDGLIGHGGAVSEYAKGAALGAAYFAIYNMIMSYEIEDKDALWDQVDDLYRRVIALEQKVNTLGG